MTALTRLGLMHGNGALPWIGMPLPVFDVNDELALDNGGERSHVVVIEKLPRDRYLVRFDSGAQIVAGATMLEVWR